MEGSVYKGGESHRRAPSSSVIVTQYFAILIAFAGLFCYDTMQLDDQHNECTCVRKMRVMR